MVWAWPKSARAPRCKVCNRRVRRDAYVEKVNRMVTVTLCREHARRGGGTVA